MRVFQIKLKIIDLFSKKAIEMAIPASYIGKTKREQMLKQKEVNNFYRPLKYLVEENSITKKHVISRTTVL